MKKHILCEEYLRVVETTDNTMSPPYLSLFSNKNAQLYSCLGIGKKMTIKCNMANFPESLKLIYCTPTSNLKASIPPDVISGVVLCCWGWVRASELVVWSSVPRTSTYIVIQTRTSFYTILSQHKSEFTTHFTSFM